MNSKITETKIEEVIGLAKDIFKNPHKYNCMAGVSLGVTQYSRKSNIKSYVSFLTRYFKEILIFINDYNYHWDIMAFQNLDKERALEKAERMGRELKNNYQNIIRKFFAQNENKVKIITFFKLLEDKKYQEFQEKFHKILEENKKIGEKIEKDLGKQILNTESVKKKLEIIKISNPKFYSSAVHFLGNYVLDQLIASLYLMFNLSIIYNVRVSPTSYKYFLTLSKMLGDKYGNFREQLEIKGNWGYLGISLPIN